jgi:hypothetical protein
MREFTKNVALHALGSFITFSAWAAITIYMFDQFDSALGKGISMQISFYIAALLSGFTSVGAAVGLVLNLKGRTKGLLCFLTGVLAAILVLSLPGWLGLPEWSVYGIAVCSSAVLCYLGRTHREPAS